MVGVLAVRWVLAGVHDRPLCKQVAPSFLFYKGGEQVAFVTGTKEKELRDVLDAHH